METIKYLITSSANPENTSLAVKGFLLGIAPIAMLLLGLDTNSFTNLSNSLADLTFWVISSISAVQVVYGIFRKIRLGRMVHPLA